jgi:hypothetical protein
VKDQYQRIATTIIARAAHCTITVRSIRDPYGWRGAPLDAVGSNGSDAQVTRRTSPGRDSGFRGFWRMALAAADAAIASLHRRADAKRSATAVHTSSSSALIPSRCLKPPPSVSGSLYLRARGPRCFDRRVRGERKRKNQIFRPRPRPGIRFKRREIRKRLEELPTRLVELLAS